MKKEVQPAMPILDESFRYTITSISGHSFGIEVKNVREVIPFPKVTKIPNVHPSTLGVFNLRGQIFSLIDLRVLLHMEKESSGPESMVIILAYDKLNFGIQVDKVLGIHRVDAAKIQLPTRDQAIQYVQYMAGFYRDETYGLVYLLDVPAIIDAPEIRQYLY
ncbi:MAG TPA: purine-binding chemotaxis protein CheW [Caldithrix abyssi]|uniref:Purine-binding chemotaxis protein CheW n=1 Tax=Caldithrix abyssi TaxID=187145 RepID=A0A7V4TZ73_CALAY|nr:purine-binding chemotaxis protein CheW [Caldithrix abyssi]